MRILVAGSNGFLGQAAVRSLLHEKQQIVRLLRYPRVTDGEVIVWNIKKDPPPLKSLENFDAIIHLGGENLAGLHWTEKKKWLIRESRAKTTQQIVDAILKLNNPPEVFLVASAIGYYGNCGHEWVDESSPVGHGFLSEVCLNWESATEKIKKSGIRLVQLRSGLVLDRRGGILPQLMLPFKWGLGCKMGNGKQFVSWITLYDWLTVLKLILSNRQIRGALNLVTPNPVTQDEFAEGLGRAFRRPVLFRFPDSLIRFFLGEMGEELLLFSTRVRPSRLLGLGFSFKFPVLENALKSIVDD